MILWSFLILVFCLGSCVVIRKVGSLQLLYLDHVDLGEINIPAGVTPRVLAYSKYRISNLIASDEISKVSFGARPVSHILFPAMIEDGCLPPYFIIIVLEVPD